MSPSPTHFQYQARRGFNVPRAPIYVRAVSGMDATNFYMTAVGGGDLGANTGFGFVTLFRLKALPTSGTQILFRVINGNAGYQQLMTASGVYSSFGNASAQVNGTIIPWTATDVGRLHLLITRITATPGVIDTYLDGSKAGPSSLSGYSNNVGSVRGYLGSDTATTSSAPAPYFEFISAAVFKFAVQTDAQFLQYMIDTRSTFLTAVATGFTGASPGGLSHRWVIPQSGSDGSAAPTTIADSWTGTTTYDFTRVGSGTVIRSYAYQEAAKNYGISACTLGSYYQTANPGGPGGSAGPFTWAMHVRIDAASTIQYLVCRSNDTNAGWEVYSGPSYVAVAYYEGAGVYKSANYQLGTNGAVGRDLYLACEYTGTSLKLYVDGALVATTAMAGTNTYVPYSAPTVFGSFNGSNYASNHTSFFGFTAKNGTSSAGEISAHYTASREAGKMIALSGAQWFYDFTTDIKNNGGPDVAPPLLLRERVSGVDHLTRTGTGVCVARRTEHICNYEATAVASGFTPTANLMTYDSPTTGHDGGAATGKSIAVLVRIDSQSVSSRARDVLSLGKEPGTVVPVALRFSGTNSTCAAIWQTTSAPAYATTPSVIIGAGDVGRLLLFVTQWDAAAGRVKLFSKRVEATSPGTAAAGYAPSTGNYLRFGTCQGATTFTTQYADGITVFAAATYDGVWSAAEVGVLFDGVAAEDDLVLLPGRMDHLYSWTRAIGTSGALPTTVADLVGSSSLTKSGSPSLQAHYTHGPKW